MYFTIAQSTIKKDMIQLQINQRITNNIFIIVRIKQKVARFSLFSIAPPPKKGQQTCNWKWQGHIISELMNWYMMGNIIYLLAD